MSLPPPPSWGADPLSHVGSGNSSACFPESLATAPGRVRGPASAALNGQILITLVSNQEGHSMLLCNFTSPMTAGTQLRRLTLD